MMRPMPRPYQLQLRWDPRDEPLIADAARIATLLHDIAVAASDSADWSIAIGSDLEPIVVTESVPQLLRAFESRRETWLYGEREFGACRLLIVNSRVPPRRVQLTATCGAWPRSTVGIWFANELTLSFWAPRLGFTDTESLLNLFCEACRLFSPSWGQLSPPDFPQLPFEAKLRGAVAVGWMTYLSAEYAAPVLTTNGSESYAVPETNGGRCLLVTKDWFSPDNPAHVAALESVQHELAAAGVLRYRTSDE